MADAKHGEHWLIYALGGGLGHLHRAITLARAARKAAHSCCILTNSPYAHLLPLTEQLAKTDQVIRIDPTLDRDGVKERIATVIEETDFDVFVVDTFPRGLGGELFELLPGISVPKVLIHRDLNPQYVEQLQLSDFIANYDKIILPGENAAYANAPQSEKTAPWLLADADEILSPNEARHKLRAAQNTLPIIAVIDSGKTDELVETTRIAAILDERFGHEACIRYIRPRDLAPNIDGAHRTLALWPLLPTYSAVSLVVGAGGYNTVQECRATATPLIAMPRKRMYDRQLRRLQDAEIARDIDDMTGKVEAVIESGLELREGLADYQNGVHHGVQTIQQL